MRVPNHVKNEQDLKDVLDRLYQESQNGKSFTGIIELATNPQVIITAIHNIKSNKGAKTAGIDGKEVDYYLQLPYTTVLELVRKTIQNYNPKPVRRKLIEKKGKPGEYRPLGIPTMLDRIVQECLRIVIEPIAEAKFFAHSYGFRPYRATKHAVKNVVQHVSHPNKTYWAIEGDIKGYFDNINHNILLEKLWKIGIIDKRVLAIIKKMLKVGVFEEGKVNPTDNGTPQGGILSPLLANIYLNDFDWMIARQWQIPSRMTRENISYQSARSWLERRGFRPIQLTRYADDWIIQVESRKQAELILKSLKKYFKYKLHLEISEEKTLITNMREKPVKFLGFNIIAEPVANKHGNPSKGNIVGKNYPNPDKVKEQIRSICNEIHKLKKNTMVESLAVDIEIINTKIVGIAEYWRTGTSKRTLTKIDHAIYWSVRAAFLRRYGTVGLHKHLMPIRELSNRPQRHQGYKDTTWAVLTSSNQWVGITKAAITTIRYERTCFNQNKTPYTEKGRKLYQNETNKCLPQDRPPLYANDEYALWGHVDKKDKYNFEYMMNREYAWNRDKGTCKICGTSLLTGYRNCHHLRPWLPLIKVNKVKELAWLCVKCHKTVHGTVLPENPNMAKKTLEYRKKLQSPRHKEGLSVS